MISIIFLGMAVALFIMLTTEKTEKAALQQELSEVMKERKRLSTEIDELKVIKSDLEVKAGELVTRTKLLSESYEREKQQNDVIRLKLDKKDKEFEDAKTKLSTIVDEKAKVQKMLEAERTKYNQLRERVDKLVDVKDLLEEKVRDIINKQGIELERIVVKSEGELEGKVLVVNREYNFVVVDIGVKDDVEVGDILTIFREGKYAGEARIEKIYDTMSAATIMKEAKPNAISVDDNVIVRAD